MENNEQIEKLKTGIRDIPNFPKSGILFKDITPLLKNPELLRLSIDLFGNILGDTKVDYVVGMESRGFIFGTALAYSLGAGFIPIRKPGKLPYHKKSISYSLEYGEDTLEIHEDAVEKGKKVIIVDDLLATGGTASATYKLLDDMGADIVCAAFLIELSELKGREKLSACKVVSLIKY
ncbi:MAG: adenine phosphoribosyltransferase [Candidatus Sericytochromatia bacterium]